MPLLTERDTDDEDEETPARVCNSELPEYHPHLTRRYSLQYEHWIL
jgi:hypothetical protein